MFSIRVKELSEPIVLWKKNPMGLNFFIGIFLRNRSLTNGRWFYGKRQNWKGKYLFNWKSLKETKCGKRQIITIIPICHICANELLDSNFNQAVIDKIFNFQSRNGPKFHMGRTTLNPSAFGATPYSAGKNSACTKYMSVPREMNLRESFDVFIKNDRLEPQHYKSV